MIPRCAVEIIVLRGDAASNPIDFDGYEKLKFERNDSLKPLRSKRAEIPA